MPFTITSYTPTTGSAAGGTTCVVTGTGLTVVTVALVGSRQATITGTTTATTLTFVTPPGTAGTSTVTLLDPVADLAINATPSFTYTAVPAVDPLQTQLASAYALRVNTGTYATPVWTKVRGIKTIKPMVAKSSEDDSDIDSLSWAGTLETDRAWSIDFTIKRGRGLASGTWDVGQEVIHAAHDQLNVWVDIMYYDRSGNLITDDAYRGYTSVQWKAQGGNKTGNLVDVTLTGQGARTKIDNPAVADATFRT